MPSQLRLDLGEPEQPPVTEPVAEKPAKKKRGRKKRETQSGTEPAVGPSAVGTARETASMGGEANRAPAAEETNSTASAPSAMSKPEATGTATSARAFLFARGQAATALSTGAPPEGRGVVEPTEVRPLRVVEVTARIKSLLEGDTVLCNVTVEGEISNLNRAGSGHVYLTLKDEQSTLRATIWAGQARRIRVPFQNGTKVIATGSISVYLPRGEYQLIVSDMRVAGLGALYEAFEKLKARLQQEGLFDASRKVPLPFLPRGIGIVTSGKGAVVQDIFRVVRRRYPNMPLYLVPVKVQGEGAAAEITAGIRRLDADPRVKSAPLSRRKTHVCPRSL